MAHTNTQSQRRQRLPVSSSDAGVSNHGGDDHSGLPCSIPLAFLTINSVSTIYRASVNGDTPMVVFIVFVYLAYLLLDYCLTELNRSPPTDRGPRRAVLKLVAWIFTTSIGFGFAYHFSQLTGPCMAVAFHALAAATSGVVFYTYFYCDSEDHGRRKWCRFEKINVEFEFSGVRKANADTKGAGNLYTAAENV